MSKISKSRLWFTIPKHWQRTLLEGQAPIIFSMGARKRNSSKRTEETLKWNKGKYVQEEGSVWCWNELLREDMKPYLVWSLHYWPGNIGDTWNIQHWLSSVTQTTRPAFPLTHDRTPSACQQGHLRSMLVDATWLLSCRQHAAATASCSHLWCQGCQDRDHSTDPVPSQAVNLCCLCAEQDRQSLHKELFFFTPCGFLSTCKVQNVPFLPGGLSWLFASVSALPSFCQQVESLWYRQASFWKDSP